jgi:hypothetical protein
MRVHRTKAMQSSSLAADVFAAHGRRRRRRASARGGGVYMEDVVRVRFAITLVKAEALEKSSHVEAPMVRDNDDA